jgi:hypothetical protein
MECSFSRTARKNQETLKTNQHGTAQSDADRLRTLIVQAEQVRRRAMESRRRRNRGNGSFVWLTRQALARQASLMRSTMTSWSFAVIERFSALVTPTMNSENVILRALLPDTVLCDLLCRGRRTPGPNSINGPERTDSCLTPSKMKS